jgi:hypothetical protein
VHWLLQGIEPKQPHRCPDGALDARGLRLMDQQSRHGGQRHLSQPLPLGDEPLLEERLVHVETQQQVATVDLGSLLQRPGSPLGDSSLEAHHIDLHPVRVQSQGATLDPQGRRVGSGQRSP